ncbi:MAG: lipopolysaccharide transport periplasmic protein LptA [Gammaproteobacteria bacterium]|nr:lipopolysaccharide transport periplasmic protein LptA [Gammaproteobacteria bacterium]MBQ0775310.1 lipopolysaccharide transport periplasmic protein LptA [Gammaproteobacteria bacterium]
MCRRPASRVLSAALLNGIALLSCLATPAISADASGIPKSDGNSVINHGSAGHENAEIIIRAESAVLDQSKGVGIYEGGAELHQGGRHLSADWIRIELKDGAPGRIEARGNPVTLIEDGALEARGKRLTYDVTGRRIQIYEQAYVNHQGRIFEGAELEYNLDTKQVDARGGDEDGRVRLVIPAEDTE